MTLKMRPSVYRYAGLWLVAVFVLATLYPPMTVGAITLDQSTYYVGDEMYVPDGSGPVVIYSLDSGEPLVMLGGLNPDESIRTTFDAVPGNYSIIETTEPGLCGSEPLSYEACKALPQFVNEFLFSIGWPPDDSGGGASGEPASGGGMIPMPSVTITAPTAGSAFPRTGGTINYSTTDALIVRLYYASSTAAIPNRDGFVDPTYKVLIKDNAPLRGSYAWEVADLAPGNLYRIIIDALGLASFMTEAVSDQFAIDFTPPTFVVSTDPPVTNGKDVVVSVDASEDLGAPPSVSVTQANASAVPVTMTGEGSHYEGTYQVIKGHDGIASIAVSGADVAGNVGTTTLSGGTFAVGVNPPPAPVLTTPAESSLVIGTSTIALAGTVRKDTEAVLTVNGIDTYTASTSPDGAFSFPSVEVSTTMNRGANILSVVARDQTGLTSAAAVVRVKREVAPTVTVVRPAEKTTLSGSALLVARGEDGNGDVLAYTYEIIPAAEFDSEASATSSTNVWESIADSVTADTYTWDSAEMADGQYFLRVIADDGFEKAYSAPVSFFIRNTLPAFRFEDGRQTVTSSTSVTLRGQVITPSAISPRPVVRTIEYSLDNGHAWKSVTFEKVGTAEPAFSVTLSGLVEGTQKVLWRAKDSRNFYGRASHLVIVDRTPPTVPVVNRPANGSFVSDSADADATKPGVQVSVVGTAEAGSTITLAAGGVTYTTKVRADRSYVFPSVDVVRGKNTFSLTAADAAKNTSAAKTVTIVYDNPPTVSITSPKPYRGFSDKGTISWSITDKDGDLISGVALEYRRGAGAYLSLPIDPAKDSFTFDVSAFQPAADYQLRLSAGDGMATSTDLVNFVIDRTLPKLTNFSLDTTVLGKGGTLTGRGAASDALSGIEYVEYAVTPAGEKSPFATALITSGFLESNATFSISYPLTLPDGAYTVYVRAVDASGNVSPSAAQTITVDTLPPHLGSFDVLSNNMRVSPDEQGTIVAYEDTPSLFEISLEGDTVAASLALAGTTTPLALDVASGLWQATVTPTAGTTTLLISARDKVDNAFTGSPIGSLVGVAKGSITTLNEGGGANPLPGAGIAVLVLNEGTGAWVPFAPGSEIVSDADGAYELALPQGAYELTVSKSGYRSVSTRVTLTRPSLINASFSLEPYRGFWGFIERVVDSILSVL